MDLKDLNIFDVGSYVMRFIQSGAVVIEHDGVVVQAHAINPVNGKIVVSTKTIEKPANDQIIETEVLS